jgi:hypothetical protein
MNNWLPFALAASVLMSSCSTVRGPSLILPTVPAIPSAAARSPDPETTTVLPPSLRRVAHSASLTIVVDDPSMALSRLQGAVLEAGGFVLSSSSWSSPGSPAYSNLSARIPSGSLSNLRQVALELATQVQSDSTYGQDMTIDLRQLQRRLQDVTQAEDHLWQFIVHSDDPQLGTSFAVVRDLLEREKADIERQLADGADRVAFAAFDVVLNQTSGLTPIE